MSELTIKVQAPDLVAAITALATALTGAPFAVHSDPAPAQLPAATPPAPVAPSAPPAQAQAQTPTAPAQPATPPPVPPMVPTAAAPTYNRDQIMTAGAALIDAGKINELMGLLNNFGVQAVTQLKQEQLGAFATELRALGAQI